MSYPQPQKFELPKSRSELLRRCTRLDSSSTVPGRRVVFRRHAICNHQSTGCGQRLSLRSETRCGRPLPYAASGGHPDRPLVSVVDVSRRAQHGSRVDLIAVCLCADGTGDAIQETVPGRTCSFSVCFCSFFLPAEVARSKPHPQPERYILPALPFLCIAAAQVVRFLSTAVPKKWISALLVLLIASPLIRSLHLGL